MTDRSHIRDEDLTAFLDGEADGPLQAEIEDALASDPGMQRRLTELSVDRDALRAGFDALLEDAPAAPASLSQTAEVTRPRWRVGPVALAASVVICLFVGGLTGFSLGGRDEQTWRDFAAAYHALYVEETLANVTVSESAVGTELSRVQEALGKQIDFHTLSKLEQMNFKRAQVLGFQGRPLVQLAFLSTRREPIALCIIRWDGATDRPQVSERMLGMSAVRWTKDGYGYLLVGGTDDTMLEEAADLLAAQL